MILAAKSNVGKVREENQDAYRFKIIGDHIAYGIVCDGMGGANGGKLASQTAVEVICEIIDQFFEIESEPYQITTLLRRAIRQANDKIYELAQQDPALQGMGTTLVIAIIVRNDVYIANVGDSRAYLFFGEAIQQISVDHSAVQELVEQGKITRDEAKKHPRKNIITRALGVDSVVEFDYFTYNFLVGDRILLCSDGLSNYCDDEILLSIINGPEPLTKKVDLLIDYANEQGGRDNITALLIQHDR